MKVSVVIPCYNMGPYIGDAVDSLESQTFTDFEVLIVDDGSTDADTIEKLKEIQQQYPDFQVLTKKNSGLAGARNYGIERAKGEYITCLDADDMFKPTYLEKTVQVLDADKRHKKAFVTTWLQEFGARSDLWKTSGYNPVGLLTNNLVHAGSLFRKSVWEEVGGYKKMKIGGYEDWNLWLSMVEKKYEWGIVEEPLFLYRIRKNSMLVGAKAQHLDIYSELYQLHPEVFERYHEALILQNAKEARELHDFIGRDRVVIEKKDRELEAVRRQNDELNKKVFQYGSELHELKSSVLVSKAILARRAAGKARREARKLAPRALVHNVRVVGAPLVPSKARKAAKKTYHAVSGRTTHLKAETRQVVNEPWAVGSPLVSVVIPYYNKADTLAETLDSLAQQTFRYFEVIIINDGSKQLLDEKQLLTMYASLHLQIINQENQGVAAARNNGIQVASGKYIVCLDPDDLLESTFIEKAVVLLESAPDTALVTTYVEAFGVRNEIEVKTDYNPLSLMEDNMVITAALFRKDAWAQVGGYKSDLGYEDWEFWINLAEHGYWGKSIHETLFRYRTAAESRFVEDKGKHWNILQQIKMLHPQYKRNIKKNIAQKQYVKTEVDATSAFVNLDRPEQYIQPAKTKQHILMALPWMTFGGAETLIINFSNAIKDSFDISYVTGLNSEHEWEYRFKEITENIYHLPNLFGEQKQLYLEFISNYITTRKVDIIHIIHTDFIFELLPELKQRHPDLKIVTTLFNDRATHFERSLTVQSSIDAFSADNKGVVDHYHDVLNEQKITRVIPNGIDCSDVFNPILFDRQEVRSELDLAEHDLAVFFIGRISPEKNPDVFIEVAGKLLKADKAQHLKFFVIGDGVMRPEVEAAIAKLNSDRVVYLGYKAKVGNYLSAADIFVLPSSVEGFPLSILEAMAMKVAVIASDVGAVSEVIESGVEGYVVTPGSVDEIASAIDELQQDRSKLLDMKRKSRKKIEANFSNATLGRNYKNLYKELFK
jgi:glycosyltransferase involved in cell wall biosynthesis